MKLRNIEKAVPHNRYTSNKQLLEELCNLNLRMPLVDKYLLELASCDVGYKTPQELIRFLYRSYLIDKGYYKNIDYNKNKLLMNEYWKKVKDNKKASS